MSTSRTVSTIEEFLATVKKGYAAWNTPAFPWFRGEPSGEDVQPLLPKVYRPKKDGSSHNENALNQFFRMKAPESGLTMVPDRKETDKWLFLARHVGLPTRLLDWTEGALIALYFGLLEEHPVVWMLNPYELNRKSAPKVTPNEPTLTWLDAGNLYFLNFKGAWGLDKFGTELPVAIHPTYVHPRMLAQHSCFTIHGKRKESLSKMVGDNCLRRYEIKMGESERARALIDLRMLGISHSTLFPDAEGLAKELEQLF